MDTLGALALGTEAPTPTVLNRKPYKRTASLISRPMWRNILCQAFFQLGLLLILLFKGAELFNVHSLSDSHCFSYFIENNSQKWDSLSKAKSLTGDIGCSDFKTYCPNKDDVCFNANHVGLNPFMFTDFPDYSTTCLTCSKQDYVHGTIIFNTFIFCQVRKGTLVKIHFSCFHVFLSTSFSFSPLIFSSSFLYIAYSILFTVPSYSL